MPEDTPGEEQPTMLSFAEAAERLVADGIAQSMTAEGLRKLARDPSSGWPIGPADYRVVGKTRMLPYELLVPYMQARRPGRGPDKSGQRSPAPKQQGERPVAEGQAGPQPPSDKDARTQIRDILLHHGWHAEQVDPLLDQFAHQLADRARAGIAQFEEHVGGFQYASEMREIIDVVDPTVPDPEGWDF